MLYVNREARYGRHAYVIHIFHCPKGLHIQNTSSKLKLLRISRLSQQRIKACFTHEATTLAECPLS